MINAFREIRLTNTNIKVSGADSRLYVGANTTVFQSETGNFITSSQTGSFGGNSNTGSLTGSFYPLNSNPSNYINSTQTGQFAIAALTGNFIINSQTGNFLTTSQSGSFAPNSNLILTGFNLQGQITTNNGAFNTYTGKQLSFSTNISPTGLDTYAITFPVTFPSAPRVQSTIEVSGNIIYSVNIQSRTTTGYNAIFSDFISESGVILHSFCSLN